jgi:hypothetical protein
MKKTCSNCNQPIPEGRLKILPNATTCVSCSTTGKVAGHPIISSKTEYSDLQIVSAETAANLAFLQNRKGYGVGRGVKFDSDLKNNQ